MPSLQRLTTEYIEQEDRFRISGEDSKGEMLSFWFTQRLLSRLITHLVSAIGDISAKSTTNQVVDERTNALVNEMAQKVAQQQIPEQPPVVDPELQKAWLVLEVDISKVDQLVKLSFKNKVANPTELLMDQRQLRQWLSILFKLWQQAEWPLSIWPDWILDAKIAPAKNTRLPLH